MHTNVPQMVKLFLGSDRFYIHADLYLALSCFSLPEFHLPAFINNLSLNLLADNFLFKLNSDEKPDTTVLSSCMAQFG